MENLKLKIASGQTIELTASDMSQINEYYEAQCTADYIRENHPNWDEEKIQEIAYEARKKMNDYGIDEEEAIEDAISDWEELHDEDEDNNCYDDEDDEY